MEGNVEDKLSKYKYLPVVEATVHPWELLLFLCLACCSCDVCWLNGARRKN